MEDGEYFNKKGLPFVAVYDQNEYTMVRKDGDWHQKVNDKLSGPQFWITDKYAKEKGWVNKLDATLYMSKSKKYFYLVPDNCEIKNTPYIDERIQACIHPERVSLKIKINRTISCGLEALREKIH